MRFKYLANFLTGLSLVCGFTSIIFALEEQFTFACWAIILSAIFDGLDGQIARKDPTPNELGKELDSLVDVIAFGIAPSILGYVFVYRDFYLWATVALFLYLLSSVMRLAKYNITSKGVLKNYFYGLPTTVSGGVLASFVLIFRKRGIFAPVPLLVPIVFLFLVLMLAYLMVSKVRYLNLDGLKKLFGRNTAIVTLFLLGLVIIAGYFQKAGVTLFSLFVIYLIFSPLVVKSLDSNK